MSRHVAAVALLVPIGSLAAGLVEVPGQAAVVAVLVGTLPGGVARGATEEAGRQLLHTDITLGVISHPPTHQDG